MEEEPFTIYDANSYQKNKTRTKAGAFIVITGKVAFVISVIMSGKKSNIRERDKE